MFVFILFFSRSITSPPTISKDPSLGSEASEKVGKLNRLIRSQYCTGKNDDSISAAYAVEIFATLVFEFECFLLRSRPRIGIKGS